MVFLVQSKYTFISYLKSSSARGLGPRIRDVEAFWYKTEIKIIYFVPMEHLICNHFSRKVVLEKWFCKLRFFFWSTTFLQPEKRWIYGIKPPFFLVNHFSRTRFLKPDFLNHFSRTTFLQLS